MFPIPMISTTASPDRSAMIEHRAVDPFGAVGEDAEPETDAVLVLAVDRIERHYTRRPALDDVGVFGSGPLSGRAPTSFDVLGAAPVADGLPTTVVLDGLRWTSAGADDDWA